MSSRTDKHESPRPKPGAVGRFDKAFPVFLEGDRGVASGIGRNITDTGMFVERPVFLPREHTPLRAGWPVGEGIDAAVDEDVVVVEAVDVVAERAGVPFPAGRVRGRRVFGAVAQRRLR